MEKKDIINTIVIMCVWNRPERLEKTFEMLNNQNDKMFDVYIWNNNKNIIDLVNEKINYYNNKLGIKIKHSDSNVGGIGRFYAAKEVSDKYDKVIFIDDDQEFNNDMITIFKNHYDVNSVKSRWAFQCGKSYMDRKRIFESNIDVSYCGTGGMIAPSHVFNNEALYEIPKKFAWIEDLWLSYYVNHVLKMKLQSIGKSNEFICQIDDGKDQSTRNKMHIKNEFLTYLRKECGWNLYF